MVTIKSLLILSDIYFHSIQRFAQEEEERDENYLFLYCRKNLWEFFRYSLNHV